jgi:hypothetical protein
MSPVSDIKITFGQIWSSSMTKYVKHLQFSNEEVSIILLLLLKTIFFFLLLKQLILLDEN